MKCTFFGIINLKVLWTSWKYRSSISVFVSASNFVSTAVSCSQLMAIPYIVFKREFSELVWHIACSSHVDMKLPIRLMGLEMSTHVVSYGDVWSSLWGSGLGRDVSTGRGEIGQIPVSRGTAAWVRLELLNSLKVSTCNPVVSTAGHCPSYLIYIVVTFYYIV